MQFSSALGLPIIGWREWLMLPDLEITQIKAKIDTGARSSALHVSNIEYFQRGEVDWVRFTAHPHQDDLTHTVIAEASLLEIRSVKNSGGQEESRPVIQTTVALGHQRWQVEMTLTSRDQMGFRMLLGREAVRDRFLVHAGQSYLQSTKPTAPPATIN